MSLAALDANYIRLSRDLRTRVVALAERQFLAVPNYWQTNEDAFIRQVVPIIVGAQRTTATLTGAWLKARLAQQGVKVPARVNLDPITKGLRGVAPADLYRRPFEQTRYQWSQGATITTAVAAGGLRLRQLAGTDLELAHTTAAWSFIGQTDPSLVPGFLRVTTSKDPCPLCVTASEWGYYRGDLLPIHDNCRCIVVPSLVAPSRQTKVAASDGTLTPAEQASYDRLMGRTAQLGVTETTTAAVA